MSDESAKCTKDKPCPAMAKYCQPSGSHRKGLEWTHTFNTKTHELSLIGVVYRETAKSDGIMLNRCPWCGERVDYWREHGDEQA